MAEVFLGNACEWACVSGVVDDGGGGRALALPLVSSLAAHSCDANCSRLQRGGTVELVARRAIAAGELITVRDRLSTLRSFSPL